MATTIPRTTRRPPGARLVAPTLAILTSVAPGAARAQPPPEADAPKAAIAPAVTLAYKPYIAQVLRANLELAAQRWNVSVASAQIAIAQVFPDPTLTVGVAAVDVSGKGSPAASTVGLSYTFELGGKRSARVAAAQADRAGVSAELEDYFRNLYATATVGYIDGLYARLALDRKRRTLGGLEKLVTINQERLRAGDAGKVALVQSRVEAERFRGEVLRGEAEVEAADLALLLHAGGPRPGGPAKIVPVGDLKLKPRTFTAEALIAQAKANRPDLAQRRRAVESATARVDLARSNRWVDLTISATWQHSFASTSAAFAQPAYDSLGATLSAPIPFSRVYRGELDVALATQAQGRATLQAAELRIEIEVRQALARYEAAAKKLGLFTGGLLTDADHVLDATLYNYQRGGATLLEVLDAQRTQNDVYLSYYDALAEHARALVTLQQAVGSWDLDL